MFEIAGGIVLGVVGLLVLWAIGVMAVMASGGVSGGESPRRTPHKHPSHVLECYCNDPTGPDLPPKNWTISDLREGADLGSS